MNPKWRAGLEEIKPMSKSDDPIVLFRAHSREKFILDQVQREADANRRGREEGRKEKIAEQMVLNMRKMNLSEETIAEATGFSMEQVQRFVRKKSK